MRNVGLLSRVVVLGSLLAPIMPADAADDAETHLKRLRSDAAYLGEIVERPAGTAEREAVLQYVRTKSGARHLARLWIRDLLDNVTLGGERVVVFGVKHRTDSDRWDIWTRRSRGGGDGLTRDRRIVASYELLLTLDPLDVEPLTFKGYEGRTFRLVDGTLAHGVTGALSFRKPLGPKDRACVALSTSRAAEPAERVESVAPRFTRVDGLPVLFDALESEDPRRREIASALLKAMGADPDEPVSYLVDALLRHSSNREPLLPALKKHREKALPILLERLADGDTLVRREAAWAIGAIGGDSEDAAAALLRASKDENSLVRSVAIHALGGLGKNGASALVAMLSDPNHDTVRTACSALGKLGPLAADAVPQLTHLATNSRRSDVRRAAARALEAIDPQRAVEVPPREARPAPRPPQPVDPETRAKRKAEIERIVREKDQAELPNLIRGAATENDPELRNAMTSAIRSFGKDALPALERVALGPNPQTAMVAVLILPTVDADVAPILIKALENPVTRNFAAMALGQVGEKAKAAVPILRRAIQNEGSRQEAVALQRIDPSFSAEVVKRLLEEGKGKSRVLQDGLASEIATYVGVKAVPLLEAARDDAQAHEDVRRVASKALDHIRAAGFPPGARATEQPRTRTRSRTTPRRESARESRRARRARNFLRPPEDPFRDVDPTTASGLEVHLAALRGDDIERAYAAFDSLRRADLTARVSAEDLVGLYGRLLTSDPHFGLSSRRDLGPIEDALVRLEDRARPAIPTLVELLDAENKDVLRTVPDTLGRLGPLAASAAPKLADLLSTRNRGLRFVAARALGRIGPAAAAAIPALVESLEFGDALYANRRFVSGEALARIGEASIPALRRALSRESSVARQAAAEALMWIGPRARAAMGDLTERLRDEDFFVRTQAAASVYEVSGRAAASLPVLRAGLEETEPEKLAFAIHCLQTLEDAAGPVVPRLAQILGTDGEDLRLGRDVIGALGLIGSDEARSVLLRVLKEKKHDRFVSAASRWIARFGNTPDDVIGELETFARSDDSYVAQAALRALGARGSRAASSVPVMLEVLEQLERADPDDDPSLRRGQLPLRFVRDAAIEALGKVGRSARGAVPVLRRYLEDEDASVRIEAARAVWLITGEAEDVLPAALRGLEDENENIRARDVRYSGVRMDALGLLGLMGPAARPAVPSLVRSVRDASSAYSLTAATALYRIGAHRDEALARLRQGLSSRSRDERVRAIYAVGEAAPEGDEFVRLLEKATEDIDYEVRRSARRALKKIAADSSR